jgi:hypothetical protein
MEDEGNSNEPLEVDKLLDLELDAKDKSDKDITYNEQQFNDEIKEDSDSQDEPENSIEDQDTDTNSDDTTDETDDSGMAAE